MGDGAFFLVTQFNEFAVHGRKIFVMKDTELFWNLA